MDIVQLLNTTVDQESVRKDLNRILTNNDSKIELKGNYFKIPLNTPIDIVSKSIHIYNYDLGFGDHLRVLVAIGGLTEIKDGIPMPLYCFATMWYTLEGDIITVDFTLKMP